MDKNYRKISFFRYQKIKDKDLFYSKSNTVSGCCIVFDCGVAIIIIYYNWYIRGLSNNNMETCL